MFYGPKQNLRLVRYLIQAPEVKMPNFENLWWAKIGQKFRFGVRNFQNLIFLAQKLQIFQKSLLAFPFIKAVTTVNYNNNKISIQKMRFGNNFLISTYNCT